MVRVIACVFEQHNLLLVGVASLVCMLSWAGALLVMERVGLSQPRLRHAWFLFAGLAAGGGSWATHMMAMLAYDPGLPVSFDLPLILLSASVGVLGAWGAFEFFDKVRGRARCVAAGVAMGLTIGGLHYLAMGGVVAAARQAWALDLVISSVAIAMALAAFAFALFERALAAGLRRCRVDVCAQRAELALHRHGRVDPDA